MQLANGLPTLPNVLNAIAGTARLDTIWNLASDMTPARVAPHAVIGVAPPEAIAIAKPAGVPAAHEVSASALLQAALQQRPKLTSLTEKLRAAQIAINPN